MRLLIDGVYHTDGDLTEERDELVAIDPDFDITRLTRDPEEERAAARTRINDFSSATRAVIIDNPDVLHREALLLKGSMVALAVAATEPAKFAQDYAPLILASVDYEAALRGESRDDLIGKVFGKMLPLLSATCAVEGMRKHLETALVSVPVEGIEPFLSEAKEQAEALIAAQATDTVTEDTD